MTGLPALLIVAPFVITTVVRFAGCWEEEEEGEEESTTSWVLVDAEGAFVMRPVGLYSTLASAL